nr:hypothetical protein [Tanacetum cinerariifolium]
MDILSPLPQAFRKLKFVIVAIDYFTIWIKAKQLVRITRKDVKKFVWENIVCRFGLPRIIVTDNGTQFVNDPFKGLCEGLNINQMNTAMAYPQANGLVDRDNKSFMKGIKARLGRERAGWVDELPNVLWAHLTDNGTQFVNDPFKGWCEGLNINQMNTAMAYPQANGLVDRDNKSFMEGIKAREDENEDELRLNMDLLQERREAATTREAKYKTKMEQYCNQK